MENEQIAALEAALKWITELTEATDGRALDMIEVEHEREAIADQIRAALPEPAYDPLDDFNYVGSRHHY